MIGIKAIRAAAEENRLSEYEGDLHADIIALCDLIETLQADCNDERSRRMALLEELEKQHDEVERLRKDAAAYHALRAELDKQMGAKT